MQINVGGAQAAPSFFDLQKPQKLAGNSTTRGSQSACSSVLRFR